MQNPSDTLVVLMSKRSLGLHHHSVCRRNSRSGSYELHADVVILVSLLFSLCILYL